MIPRVSLIIPTYNRGEILADTIRMATSQDYPNYEVIVVDQSAEVPDSVREASTDAGPLLRYIRLPHPNLPAARNVGVRAATGEIIVFIDDDVILQKEHVSQHARHYTRLDVGGVAGLALMTRTISMAAAVQSYANLLGAKRPVYDGEVVPVGALIGCNMSYRKRAIVEAGMSDERFRGAGWGEDTDLSMRVKRKGYELLYDSNNKLIHLAVPTGGCDVRNAAVAGTVNQDRVELSTYLAVKNWKSVGFRSACLAIWGSYRGTTLNRPVVRGGLAALRRSHLDWLRMMARIIRKLSDLIRTSASVNW